MGDIGTGAGTSYPGSLDVQSAPEKDLPDPNATKVKAGPINDLAAAVIALETELGLMPAGSAVDLVTRLAVEINLDGSSKAKGSMIDLVTRLGVEMNDDGTFKLKGSTTSGSARIDLEHNQDGTHKALAQNPLDFRMSGDTITFISSSSFSVPADRTSVFVPGLRLRSTLTSGIVYSTIKTAGFASSITTITIEETNLDNTISLVDVGFISSGPTGSIPKHDHSSDNQGGITSLLNEVRKNATAILANTIRQQVINDTTKLILEDQWVDAFVDFTGINETLSSGHVEDAINKLIENIDGGTGLNYDFDFSDETKYLQKQFTTANQSTSQATFTNASAVVTLGSGAWPTNALNMRISPDNGVTWYDILSRDTNLQITLATNFTGTTGARDYIIRPTEFAVVFGSDIVPAMTTWENGNDFVASSSELGGNYVYNAFKDDDTASFYQSQAGSLPVTIQHSKVNQSKNIIKKYRLMGRLPDNESPGAWKLQGSDDFATWKDIDSQSGITGWVSGGWKEFEVLSNNDSFANHRLYITASAAPGPGSVAIAEIEFLPISSGTVQMNSVIGTEVGDVTQAGTTDDTQWALGDGAKQKQGAHFTAGNADKLTKVQMLLKKTGAPTFNLTCTINQVVAGVVTNTVLATADATLAASSLTTSHTLQTFTFTFANALQQVNTTQYAIVLTPSVQGNVTDHVIWKWLATGGLDYWNGTSWVAHANGLDLKTFTTPLANSANENIAVVPAISALKFFTNVTSIVSGTVTETGGGGGSYALILLPAGVTQYDDANTLVISLQPGGGWKRIVKWNVATSKWERNNDVTTSAAETWVTMTGTDATDIVHAIAKAIGSNGFLGMLKANLEAVTDAQFEGAGGFIPGTHVKYGFAYRNFTGSSTTNKGVDLFRVVVDADNAAMTLQFNPLTTVGANERVYFSMQADESIGTPIVEVSRDNGVTLTPAVMTPAYTISGNIKMFTSFTDLSGVAAGTQILAKITLSQADKIKIYGAGLAGRSI